MILFDIGAGNGYQQSDGLLPHSLAGAGVSPASVTKIVFTHAHPDHIAATLDLDGTLRFPNATYFVGSDEWDFWMDPDFFNKVPAGLHDFGRGAQRDLGAIRDRVVLIRPGDDVVTGSGRLRHRDIRGAIFLSRSQVERASSSLAMLQRANS